jgi:hypothetical protein
MKKLVLLMIALVLLTGSAMAQVIISSTTIDAIGNMDSSSEILLRTTAHQSPSSMLPSRSELVYNENTLSSGIVLILFDKDRTTFTNRPVIPSEDPPVEFDPDPRVTEVDPESAFMDVLTQEGSGDQILNLSNASTNFDTFRTSRNLSAVL